MTTNFDLRYLHIELARIDLLVQRQVKRMQLAGNDPNDRFRGLYVSEDDANALTNAGIMGGLRPLAELSTAVQQQFAQANAELGSELKMLRQAARGAKHTFRLQHLQTAFELSQFEYDALLIALAPLLDLRYERLYSYLQDDVTRKRASINLILDMLAPPGPARLTNLHYFYDEAPLFRYQLAKHYAEGSADRTGLLAQTLIPDETVLAWVLGHYHPRDDVLDHMRLGVFDEKQEDLLMAADVLPDLELASDGEPILAFVGPDASAQAASARLLAARRFRPLLTVSLAALIEQGLSPLLAVRLALRDARLTEGVAFLTGWDACLHEGAPAPALLEAVLAHPKLVILAGLESWMARGVMRDRLLIKINFPIPQHHQRQALWKLYAPEDSGAELDQLADLAGQFALTSGQIRDAVATAQDLAKRRGQPLNLSDLQAASREHSNPRLGAMARKITPRYQWDDIILPDDQRQILQEIVDTVRGRPKVLQDWGVGRKLAASAGVTVLFAGDPGTGKTMSAEVIAGELGLELFKIDLSGVVSKYIGETEKNLETIFSEAQNSNAILFFDEADSIFGKRSEVKDAHDRYANLEISYLLQRMEAYDGVTILATNLRANLDDAFTRRLQFAVDFPFPEAEDRLRIWKTLFPADVPIGEDLDFEYLAETFKIAGGNIRNIIVTAAYLAAADPVDERVWMRHMLHSTRREMQKMGRLMNVEWEADSSNARNGKKD